MTTRRFNYTGCKRIRRADVAIGIVPEAGHFGFQVEWDLSPYEFPLDARIVLEAYVNWSIMRFEAGTVAEPALPASTLLSEFDVTDGLQFRLKVLGEGDHAGLILGEADRLKPSDLGPDGPAKSLLAVRPGDLGHVVWQLSFDEAQPVLVINSKVGDWQAFLRRGSIRALLMPELLRQLLREAIDNESDEDDTGAWQAQVLRLIPGGAGVRPEANDEDATQLWIEEAVGAFAERHKLWKGMAELLAEES
jgi:hypothetical protein